MASAAGIIIAAGAVTLASEALAVPVNAAGVSSAVPINWRVIPATAVAAGIFYGIEQLNHTLGIGLAVMALITTLVTPMGNTGVSPVTNLFTAMGYPDTNLMGPFTTVWVKQPDGSYIVTRQK